MAADSPVTWNADHELSHYWSRDEAWTLVRRPVCYLKAPPAREVRRQLWSGLYAVASFTQQPDAEHPANVWLYVCTDKAYSMKSVSSKRRCSIRRGNEALKIEFVTSDQWELPDGFRAPL